MYSSDCNRASSRRASDGVSSGGAEQSQRCDRDHGAKTVRCPLQHGG